MSDNFAQIKKGEDHRGYVSRGMDVYLNCGIANINICGRAVHAGSKFAILDSEIDLNKYLRKGMIKLVEKGFASTTAESAEEAPKPKKKKSSETVEADDVPAKVEEQQIEQVIESAVADSQDVTISTEGNAESEEISGI